MTMKWNVSFSQLLIIVILLMFTGCCEKDPGPSKQELLTSTWWSLTEDCGTPTNCGESCILGFSPNGHCTDNYNYFSTWSIKKSVDEEFLIIDQDEYKILELTEAVLRIKKNWLLGCKYSYKSISRTPIIETKGISDLTQTSAKLYGFITTDKTALAPKIEYGTTTSYGLTSAFQTTVPRVTSMGFISHMTNTFSPGTTYHYRFIGVSGSQTFYGPDLTFRTFNTETLSDINGNVYNTVDIGTQVWMAKNLRVNKYNDGKNIPYIPDNTSWGNMTSPGYCWCDNDSIKYKNTDGAIYNWYTVNTGKLCPTGWHVPSDQEWTTLEEFLGENYCAKMFEGKNFEGWSNESGFSATGTSYRTEDGSGFVGITSWWTSTEENSDNAWIRGCERRNWNKKTGGSVRCIKDK